MLPSQKDVFRARADAVTAHPQGVATVGDVLGPRSALAIQVAFLAAALAGACRFGVNLEDSRFTCTTDEECGDRFTCRPQKTREQGVCYAEDACAAAELCDGRDDDCNGVIDDDAAGVGEACTASAIGECSVSKRACVDGQIDCPAAPPTAEICDGKDNDCNGTNDDGFDLATDENHCGRCGNVCAAGALCVASACIEDACGDGVDNDGDGPTDCADTDCDADACGAGCACQGGAATEVQCNNAADDDRDGPADCDDLDCNGRACDTANPSALNCGITPVGDGGVPDAGASDAGTPDAGPSDAATDDAGVPDAGDVDAGAADGGVDGGAGDAGPADGGPDGGTGDAGPADSGRSCLPREAACGDGFDDDGDGRTDCEDLDCDARACGPGNKKCTALQCQ